LGYYPWRTLTRPWGHTEVCTYQLAGQNKAYNFAFDKPSDLR
jgi:hypothetical protein